MNGMPILLMKLWTHSKKCDRTRRARIRELWFKFCSFRTF